MKFFQLPIAFEIVREAAHQIRKYFMSKCSASQVRRNVRFWKLTHLYPLVESRVEKKIDKDLLGL